MRICSSHRKTKAPKKSEDSKGYNQRPNLCLEGEPDAGFLDNTLQIISEYGKVFLLLQLVFLGSFLIGNESAMKVILEKPPTKYFGDTEKCGYLHTE